MTQTKLRSLYPICLPPLDEEELDILAQLVSYEAVEMEENKEDDGEGMTEEESIKMRFWFMQRQEKLRSLARKIDATYDQIENPGIVYRLKEEQPR